MVARICQLVRTHGDSVRQKWRLASVCERTLWDLSTCRTAVRGGHVENCADCGRTHRFFNSCRNRHCPQCQADKARQWVETRIQRCVPVGHHQVVFTLPSELRPLARQFPEVVYGMLFSASAETLHAVAATRSDATIGFTSVLHTWNRDLSFHPHVHSLVTTGGFQGSESGNRWVYGKCTNRFLFPVSVLRRVFRAKMFDRLDTAHRQGIVQFDAHPSRSGRKYATLKRALRSKSWVVRVEPPGDRPVQQALRYLGRYVYRVAIWDARVLSTGPGHVTFRTRGEGRCTLKPVEFVRRLMLHVLPRGFRKIRHYGLYAPSNASRCAEARTLFETKPSPLEPPEAPREAEAAPRPRCRHCGGLLVRIEVDDWLMMLDDRQWHAEISAHLPWEDL